MTVLMGANLANEVADEKFCETTIGIFLNVAFSRIDVIHFIYLGSKCPNHGAVLKSLFQTDNFRVTIVPDVYTVEICGALKVCLLMMIVFPGFKNNLFSEYRGLCSWFF